MMTKEKMFQTWFNTFFVKEEVKTKDDHVRTNGFTEPGESLLHDRTRHPNRIAAQDRSGSAQSLDHSEANDCPLLVLTMDKDELDKAHKDKANKLFSPNFKVRFYFSRVDADLPDQHHHHQRPASISGVQGEGPPGGGHEVSSDNEESETESEDDEWEGCDTTTTHV